MFFYKLRADVQIEKKSHGCYLFSLITERYVLWHTEEPSELIKTLQSQWVNEDDMAGLFSQSEETPDWPTFFYFFDKLISAGFLIARFIQNGEPVFSINPAPPKSIYQTKLIKPETRYRLSRFSLIRQDDGEMVLESALTPCRFIIHKKQLSELLFHLCSGMVPDISNTELNMLLAAFYSAGIIEAMDSELANHHSPLDVWEFHDLLFFSRTQKGRHLFPIGGSYRFVGKRKSPPVVKAIASDDIVPLKKPYGILSDKMGKSFEKVLEKRRSLRNYASIPISLDEFAAFLFHSSRIQGIVHDDAYNDVVSLRPSPSGGARHAFEIYPFVRICDGCEPGIYRYCPQKHVLEKIKSAEMSIQKLLDWNPHKVISPIPPHITLYIAARFERMSWKYESIAYKLIHQDLGCLYQTFYLVAEALDLAPCALGDVDTTLLGHVLKIDWQIEPFIGGFTLGRRHE